MSSQTMSKDEEKKIGFFKGVKSEMKRVSWPTKKTLVNHTIIVIVMCIFMSLFIGVLDLGFQSLIGLIVK